MWLLELVGLSAVVGIIGGVAWRFGEDYLERRETQRVMELELTANKSE
jgi:hypothetical protein